MAAKPRSLIIGAGIGGLTGLALLRRGYPVAIFDQAPALSELGAGIEVAANGSRVLRALGLGDELDRIGIVAGTVDLRSTEDRLHGNALKKADTAKQHVDEKFSAANMAALYDGIYGYDAISVAI